MTILKPRKRTKHDVEIARIRASLRWRLALLFVIGAPLVALVIHWANP